MANKKTFTQTLDKAGLDINDVNLEVNEAFLSVPLAFMKELNVNVLHRKEQEFGLVTLCNSGGGASTLVIKAL